MKMRLLAALLLALAASACTEHYVGGKTYYCDYVPMFGRVGCVTQVGDGAWEVVWP